MFCYFKTKKFLLKNVTPGSPLLWSVKIFDTLNILKQRRVPLGKYFGTVRTESFGWKSRNPRTLFLSLSLSLSLFFSSKLFDTRKLFEGRRVPLWKLSILWETKNNQQKFVPLPSFINKNFLYPNFSVTQEGSSTKWFGIMRQNNFDGKSWYRLPLLSIFFFRYQKYSETQKISSSNCFGSVRRKSFDRKSWHPLSVFSSLYFHTRKFLEDRRDPLRKSWALWETKSNQQKIVLPHSFINERLRYPKLFETQKGSSR